MVRLLDLGERRIIECFKELASYVVVDIKCVVNINNMKKLSEVLSKSGFKKAIPGDKVVYYKVLQERKSLIVVERTAKPNTIVLKLCKALVPIFPLPPLACSIRGKDVCDEVKDTISILKDIASKITSQL